MKQLFHRLSLPLKQERFRAFFYSQTISGCGTFIQLTVLQWLAFNVTHSLTKTGIVSAVGILPIALFSIPAGVFLDFHDKRKVMFVVQVISLILSLAVVGTMLLGYTTYFFLGLFSFLTGAVSAIDAPGRTTIIRNIVDDPKWIPSSMSLNSTMTTMAQAVGGPIGGIFISLNVPMLAFLVNALSFIPVMIILWKMKLPVHDKSKNDHPWEMLKGGMKWTFSHGDIVFLSLVCIFVGFLVRSYPVILTKLAEVLFGLTKAKGGIAYGLFTAATGAGACVAGLIITAYAKEVSHKTTIKAGLVIGPLALIGMGFVISFSELIASSRTAYGIGFLASFVLLFLIGLAFILVITPSNIIVQLRAAKEAGADIGGRATSIFYCGITIGLTTGSYLIGKLADKVGLSYASYVFGIALVFVSVISWSFVKHIKDEVAAPGPITE